jgi:hypothetical protein
MHRRDSSWSADARALLQPAAAYRELAAHDAPAFVFGRPLLLAFVLGCTVSLVASGRLSVRLVADGAVSFAFLPVCCVAGFAIVYFRRRDCPPPFARALDIFLSGQLPWLLWLIALAGLCSVVPPRGLGPWLLPLEVSIAIPAVWSGVADFHFFRQVMARAPRAAVLDLLLYRAVAWTAAAAYFFGIAIWYEVIPAVIEWPHR